MPLLPRPSTASIVDQARRRAGTSVGPQGGVNERRQTFGRRWARAASFKAEAWVFLLLVLTFAAVLGQDAFTREKLSLTPTSSRASAYSFDDRTNGGHSVLQFNSAKPLSWTCELKPGFAYPFCGYGLVFNEATPGKGVDLSYMETVRIKLNYHGPRSQLRLALKNFDPTFSRVGADDTAKPNTAVFDVVEGENVVELTAARFEVEAWWAASKKLTPEQAKPDFRNIIAIDFISGSGAPPGKFSVKVEEIEFQGVHLSPEQFYLIIIGAWLVLSAIFLIYRFFHVKRSYERRQREEAENSRVLAEARTAAEAANAAKSQFLANMSHELRTPLNAIIGYAQLLERDNLSEWQRSAVDTIHQSGDHLLALITDILDLSKVEAGKLEMLPAPVDLRACIAGVNEMIRLRAEEKGLIFAAEIAADVPSAVMVDGKRLRQILINLLGNAIKFTAEGEVRLEISAIGWGGGDVRVRFDILDTGPGIAAEQMDRIFQPFEQAGSAADRSGGTGLGLSISRHVVEMMGGEISVRSTEGRGSRFRFELPLALQARNVAAPAAASPNSGEKREILVVDDLETNRALLRGALEGQGYCVREAGDGLEALDMLETARPDLIVMDVKMPVMDGLEALRRLRTRPGLAQLPVIAVSANPSAELEASVRRAGADRLLPKPIDLSRLEELIVQLLAASAAANGPRSGESDPLVAPRGNQMQLLLEHARAGNMRAVRAIAADIAGMSDEFRPFAERLQTLAASYQSPAVLRLVEQQLENEKAA